MNSCPLESLGSCCIHRTHRGGVHRQFQSLRCHSIQCLEDIVVEIDGQYWAYCAVLDVDYTTNDDGTYTCRGNIYKYMFEVSGVDGESQVTYIILSNNAETGFEEVAYSLRMAEISTETPEFIILGWYY